MVTLLMLAMLAVGLFIAGTLYRIERRVEASANRLLAWGEEHPPAFTFVELARQRLACDQAASELKRLTDGYEERWGGKTVLSVEDDIQARSDLREVESSTRAHSGEVRHLSLMVQANARVRLGRELLGDAIKRVESDWVEQWHIRGDQNMREIFNGHEHARSSRAGA